MASVSSEVIETKLVKPVVLYEPMYRLGYSKNILFSSSRKLFNPKKYILGSFESKVTELNLCSRGCRCTGLLRCMEQAGYTGNGSYPSWQGSSLISLR